MRSENEMLELILSLARQDERIRAVTLSGSRADPRAAHDRFSDFDIVFLVEDIRSFTGDHSWISCFGETLIVQMPEDWYNHPYDYAGTANFAYLMQFRDGNRIDLTLVDQSRKHTLLENPEPNIILLDKDKLGLTDTPADSCFLLKPPTEQEFSDCCNEFWWLSLYIAKGLSRREFFYARYHYERSQMDMLLKLICWRVGAEQGFNVTVGSHAKYLKRYLSPEEMEHFQALFPNGNYEDMWDKLLAALDYFAELELFIRNNLGFTCRQEDSKAIRAAVRSMKLESASLQ